MIKHKIFKNESIEIVCNEIEDFIDSIGLEFLVTIEQFTFDGKCVSVIWYRCPEEVERKIFREKPF